MLSRLNNLTRRHPGLPAVFSLERLAGRATWPDYLAAAFLAAAALAVRATFESIASGIALFVLLFPAVVAAAVLSGAGPAALTAILGATIIAATSLRARLLSFPPINAAHLDMLGFALACGLIVAATAALRRAAGEAIGAQARLAEVFAQLPGAAAIIAAPDGKLVLRTVQSDDILGHPPGDIAHAEGAQSYGGLHPDGQGFAPDDYPIIRALRTGAVIRRERIRYRRGDGRIIDLDVHAGPVRGATGKDGQQEIIGAVGMAFDVTEQVAAEARLRDSEAQARETAAQLQAALESRGILMHEADHRIKNSLQLVSSLLSLQAGRTQDADARAALEAAMLRVSAVAQAHLALQTSPDLRSVDVALILSDLCDRLGLLNPDVTLHRDLDPGVFLDAEQAIPLGLIASEILTNALRHAFAPGQAGEVRITAHAAATTFTIVIADNGAGMPQNQPRTGLGTTVVRALLKQIDANIAVQSAPGQGTTMTVTLTTPTAPLRAA